MNPLQAIRDEIARLENLKSAIEQQLIMLRESERALAPVYHEQNYISVLDAFPHGGADAGLTQKIRQLLVASYPGHATPIAIRDLLVRTGQINPQGRSNFLAEIHNILKRLVIQNEVEEIPISDGRAYRAKPPEPVRLAGATSVNAPTIRPETLTQWANNPLSGKSITGRLAKKPTGRE